MGQTVTKTNTFDHALAITIPVHVVVLNNYTFSGSIDISASTANYTVKLLLNSIINTLQQIHQPTTYHIHYISFSIKQSHSEINQFNHKKNHIGSQQIYYSNHTKTFDKILKSDVNNKEFFKFEFLTECDIEIPINVSCLFNTKYNVNNYKLSVCYNNNYFIRDILNDIIFFINSKHKHDANITCENIQIINQHSFCKNSQKNYPITHYKNIFEINKIGINIELVSKPINCPYITSNKICPIYSQMIKNKNINPENYKHLFLFNHFKDNFMSTQECPDSYNCKSYIRLKNKGNNLNDKCHLKLYKHPIVTKTKRYDTLKQNVSHFFNQTEMHSNDSIDNLPVYAVYLPSIEDEERFNFSYSDLRENGYLKPLKQEIINNGFQTDLYLNGAFVMDFVEEKMDLFRQKNISNSCDLNKGEMLALILYLNGKCMKDLSETQLNGNYLKWKWFDRCLYDAIDKLSKYQFASYPIYFSSKPIIYVFNELHSEKTLLDGNISININKMYKDRCFKTYIIGSKYKEVQLSTLDQNELDVLIEINKSFTSKANKCCDISWISNFPDQYEIIMQRNLSHNETNEYIYKCCMADGIQTITICQ